MCPGRAATTAIGGARTHLARALLTRTYSRPRYTERRNVTVDQLGPVEYVAVEFPAGRIIDQDGSLLLDAVDRGPVRVLDLEFVHKPPDGAARRVELDDVPNPDGVDLGVWRGAFSGLLDGSDIAEIATEMEPGGLAAVVIYENLWIVALGDGLARHGARLIADGGIAASDVLAALDQTESG